MFSSYPARDHGRKDGRVKSTLNLVSQENYSVISAHSDYDCAMRAIIFYHLQQAECALAAAAALHRPLTLLTAPGAAAYGGPGFYLAMVEQARARHPGGLARAILDCGNDGAMAQMALALGWRCVVLRGRAAVRDKVSQIAAAYEAEVLPRAPKALDPGAEAADITGQCRALLETR